MTAIPPHLHHAHPSDGHDPRGTDGWNEMYSDRPEWDLGRPQPAMLYLLDRGGIRGRVLDVGCGTGEHVLMCAERGLAATGIDISSTAIDTAKRKAAHRGVTATFRLHDATELAELNERFDTVLDCGLFVHIVDEPEVRTAFIDGLRAVVVPGGRYAMVCFRGQGGHHRSLTRAEIESFFADGWHVEEFEPITIEGIGRTQGIPAWLVTMTRQ
ncbi:class I SAM-dependent methyltransferase [Nocardia gipuzkoensis]|uniref:class I SAM-dependent methyltransferase n=1 Tax=Nocardia gipuzkoensis TaxID=2749991 RepID=UPI003EE1CF86